jgi:membrane-associated phospholipid phosphatase
VPARRGSAARAQNSSGVAVRTRILVLLCLMLPLAVFGFVAAQVSGRDTPAWDRSVLRFAYAHEHDPGIWRLANGWVDPASRPVVAGILVALALLLLAYRKPLGLAFVLVSLASALALETGLKHAFAREALYEGASSYSFPSGHAMAATAIAAAAAYVLPRMWLRVTAAIAGGAWAIEVGVASVVQHNHYPSDVVGGWTIAVAWVTALWLLVRGRLR